jgi:hypothetical protein
VLWLPLTAHCELETIVASTHEAPADDGCCVPSDDCADDACGLIEGAQFQPTHSVLKAPLPELKVEHTLALILAQMAASESVITSPDWVITDHPLDWTATWCFTRRAAPPARAPTTRA